MTRFAAFLRGINLGNRRVKMDELRARFEALDGLENVATFIASGNVVFDQDPAGPAVDPRALERRIAAHLEAELGYDVDTFVRELEGLRRIADAEPAVDAGPDFNAHVLFLHDPVPAEARGALRALESADDRFHPLGRELLWLRRGRLSDSTIDGRQLEVAVGASTSTMRNLNTLRRMLAKFSPGAP